MDLEGFSQGLLALLPVSRAIKDLREDLKRLTDSPDANSTKIEVETGWIEIPNDVQVDPIAYVLQHGFSGEASHLRVTLGLGGMENRFGVNIPELCFARLIYNVDGSFRSVDYYVSIG